MLFVPFVQAHPIWTVIICFAIASFGTTAYLMWVAPMIKYRSEIGDDMPLDDHEIKLGE